MVVTVLAAKNTAAGKDQIIVVLVWFNWMFSNEMYLPSKAWKSIRVRLSICWLAIWVQSDLVIPV